MVEAGSPSPSFVSFRVRTLLPLRTLAVRAAIFCFGGGSDGGLWIGCDAEKCACRWTRKRSDGHERLGRSSASATPHRRLTTASETRPPDQSGEGTRGEM